MMVRLIHSIAEAVAMIMLLLVALPACAAHDTSSERYEALIADAKAKMAINPAQTVAIARAAQATAAQLPSRDRRTGVATAQWLKGEANLRLNKVGQAAILIGQALAVVKREPLSKLKGDILISQGGVDSAKADVAAALADYQQAHNIFRDLGETRSRALALLTIGQLYYDANDYLNALKYLNQALDVYHGDPGFLYSIHNNRANSLKDLKRLDEAVAEYGQALAIARTLNSPFMEARVLSNLARTQLLKGNTSAADRLIAQGFEVSSARDAAIARNQFWVLSAQSAYQNGDLRRAATLISRAFVGTAEQGETLDAREGHQVAYDIFKKLGDEPKALQHLEALKHFDDQTSTLAASANTALMAAKFDSNNQQLKIAKLQRDEAKRSVEFERTRARTQRFIFIGAAGVTVIIVGMLGFGLVTIRRSRNEVRAANIDLAETNSALGKALAAKTEFLATTSHEIRTPLNGILGMTQVMLADGSLPSATRDRINVVHGAGVSMRALVDDILDVAKMETGNMTIERVPFDLHSTLTDLSRMWLEQAEGRGLGFALELDHCPTHVLGDPARLRQIAFNLLSNALKFTEVGSISLTVWVRHRDDAEQLMIAVNDTGIGIPADKHELIFESFRQADGGTTRKFGGTGLGLSICRNLARAMGGDVTVESEEGRGSTFTLTMPLVRAEAEIAAAAPKDETFGLLIIDRNPITRAMIKALLEPRVDIVAFAGSIDEACTRIAAGGVAMALIDDATANATDDVDAALSRLTRAAREAGARTVTLWAGLDDASRARLTAAGVDLAVAKPITGPALADLLFADRIRNDRDVDPLASEAA